MKIKKYIALLFYKIVFCYDNSLKTSFIVLFCIQWTWLSESTLTIKNNPLLMNFLLIIKKN